jgi:hypothetical protein
LTTAREKLYDEVVALTESPPGGDAESVIRKIMTRYRVQTKPGVNIPDGMTARDALGERLLSLWHERPPDLQAKLGSFIDDFRMQVKQTGASGTKPPKKVAAVPLTAQPVQRPSAAAKPISRPDPAQVSARSEAPPPESDDDGDVDTNRRRRVVEPVGGGPRRKGRSRAECPKCHSMGVVLARSYAGDEYYSCIYCGWQAYKPADENDPTASLAVKLLGQSLPEK